MKGDSSYVSLPHLGATQLKTTVLPSEDEINECLGKLVEVKTELKRAKRKHKSDQSRKNKQV